jgi:beta-barrel assembly-enhancing protease
MTKHRNEALSPATRRAFVMGLSCSGLMVSGSFHAALAALDPKAMTASLSPKYQPHDKDEQGLWMQMEQVEEDAKKSNFIIRDAALNSYLTDLCCKLAGDFCSDIRVYTFRTPYFNASMYPNGMMHIWSGLLLRAQNEAQLAAVLGHEIGHYLRQHSLKRWRDIKSKTAAFGFLQLPLLFVGGGIGALALQMAMIGSIFANSREDEREADAFGLQLMEKRGIAPDQAAVIWQQLIAEQEATAKGQGKKKAKAEPIFFATHPQSALRMADLAAAAKLIVNPMQKYDDGKDRFMQAVGPLRGSFFDDQLKLEDFGGTKFLLEQLSHDGWTGELLHYKGELYRQHAQQGDYKIAMDAYSDAITKTDAPPEAHRGLGYILLKTGEQAKAQTAFRTYLELRPAAPDKAMIEFNLQ